MQEGSLSVLNGRTEGDWDGEFTFVGTRDCTVIDYVQYLLVIGLKMM